MAMQDLPIPPELALDDEPLTDTDLARYFDALQDAAGEAGVDAEQVAGWLAEQPGDQAPNRVARFRIEDDNAAEWAMRKLALAQAEVAQLQAQAQEWADRIQHWFVQAARPHADTLVYMEERLADYGLRRRQAGGSATLNLPSGAIKTTSSSRAVEVADDEAVAAYVREVLHGTDADRAAAWREAIEAAELAVEGDLVRTSHKVYVGPLRELARATEVQTGDYELVVVLGCGHTHSSVIPQVDDLSIPVRGELVGCQGGCGSPQPVASTITKARTHQVVLGPDGREVPGAQVREGGITAKVVAR